MSNLHFNYDLLGWMVIHSIWITALAYLVVLIVDHMTTARHVNTRYWTTFGAMILSVVGTIMATLLLHGSAIFEAPQSTTSSAHIPTHQLLFMPQEDPHLCHQLDHWLPYLAIAWMTGLALLTARLLVAMYYPRYMRHRSLPCTDDYLVQYRDSVARRMGIERRIDLRMIDRNVIPSLVGCIKPYILLPIAMMNELTVQELELIIAHELAHYRRRDHVVLFAQRVIETLLYFHPLIWLMSRRLEQLREEACDDYVVYMTGRQQSYARTLYKVQSWHLDQPTMAIGLTGSQHHLLHRIQRLLNMEPTTTRHRPYLLALAAPLLIGLFAFYPVKDVESTDTPPTRLMSASAASFVHEMPTAQSCNVQVNPVNAGVLQQHVVILADTTDPAMSTKDRSTYTIEEDGQRTQYIYEDGELVELTVNGESIDVSEATPDQMKKLHDLKKRLPSKVDRQADIKIYMNGEELFPADEDYPSGRIRSYRFDMDDMDWSAFPEHRFEFHMDSLMDFDMDGLNWPSMDSDSFKAYFFSDSDIQVFDSDSFLDGSDGLRLHIEKSMQQLDDIDLDIDIDQMGQDLKIELHHADSIIRIEMHDLHEHLEGIDEIIKQELDKMKKEMEHHRAKPDQEGVRRIHHEYHKSMNKARRLAHKQAQKARKMASAARTRAHQLAKEARRSISQQRIETQEQVRKARAQAQKARKEQGALIRQYVRQSEREASAHHRLELQAVQDGLITDTKNYSLRLDATKLKINGKKMSSDVHKHYLDIYKHATDGHVEHLDVNIKKHTKQ